MSVELSQTLRLGPRAGMHVASVAQTTANLSSADLAAMSLGGAVSSPTLQARRDVAIQRFVMAHGFTFRGDIDRILAAEADRMVAWGLFDSEQEAEDAIVIAYQAFVQKAGRIELDKALEMLRDPDRELVNAVTDARIRQKEAEYVSTRNKMSQAKLAVPPAVQKWLGIHKKLKAHGIDALVPGWEQSALAGKRGLERASLKVLLKDEKAAREEFERAQEKRDSLQKRLDEIGHYLEPGKNRPYKEVEAELDKFFYFLQDCFVACKFNAFVESRVESLQEKFKSASRECTRLFDPSKGSDDFSLDDAAEVDGYERLYRNGLLHAVEEAYIQSHKTLELRLKNLEESSNLTQEDRLLLEKEALDVHSEAISKLKQLEERYEKLQNRLLAIRYILGREPLDKPIYSVVEEAASLLDRLVDIGDSERIAAFLQKEMAAREALGAVCDSIDSQAEEADIRFRTIDEAYNTLLTKLQEEMVEFDYILPLLLENEGLVYDGPCKDDVAAFIELHKLREYAEKEKDRLFRERYRLGAQWIEQCVFLENISAIDLNAYMQTHSHLLSKDIPIPALAVEVVPAIVIE